MAHPGGRPTNYTEELAIEICNAIATDSKGLRRLCSENPHWPMRGVIYEWLFKHPEFHDLYAKAKARQVELLVDDMLEIADDTSRDDIIRTNKDGDEYEVCNTEWINRSRVRIDTRKWIASKLMPKVYGERIEKTISPEGQSLLQNVIDKL